MEATLGVIGAILAVVLPLLLAGWLLGWRVGGERQQSGRVRRAKMPR